VSHSKNLRKINPKTPSNNDLSHQNKTERKTGNHLSLSDKHLNARTAITKMNLKRANDDNDKKASKRRKPSYEEDVISYTSASEEWSTGDDSPNDKKDKTPTTESNKKLLDDASSDEDHATDEEKSTTDEEHPIEESDSQETEHQRQSKGVEEKTSNCTSMSELTVDDYDKETLTEEDMGGLSTDESVQASPKEGQKQNTDAFTREKEKRSLLSQEKEKTRKKWNEMMQKKIQEIKK